MTPAQHIKIQREIGLRGSLHRFVKMAFSEVEPGETFVDNWHIEEICTHLEACWRGETRQLAITIPPGCMKSLIVSVLFPVWCWIRDPSIRFSVIGYDEGLTGGRDGGKVVKLIQSEWFRKRWGDRVMVPTDPATSNVKTQAGGFRFATSIRGKYTGQHVHFEVVDDPIKPQNLSKVALEEVRTWRTGTAPTRLLPAKDGKPGARIYIMQRLHEDDIVGQVEKEPGWTFLRLPMRFEAEKPCRTQWGGDRRTADGELLWPERFTEEIVASREAVMGSRNTAAQFQQRPTPAGGLIFQRPWFKFYKTAPGRFDAMCQSWDLAFKDTGKNDFICGQVWGRKGADFYLLDLHLERLDFPSTLSRIRSTTRKWPKVIAKLVEDKANGPAVLSMLKKDIPGLIEVNPQGGKEARANAVAPLHEAGNVHYPDPDGAIINVETQTEPTKTPFIWEGRPSGVDPHLDSMAGFPFAAHDDDVDAETQALLHLRMRASRWLAAMAAIRGK